MIAEMKARPCKVEQFETGLVGTDDSDNDSDTGTGAGTGQPPDPKPIELDKATSEEKLDYVVREY